MPNTNLNASIVTKESLNILHNECQLLGKVDKQFDNTTEYSGLKRGSTVQIRLPNQYKVRNGATMNTQDNVEKSTTLAVATMTGIDLPAFTSQELAQDIDSFSKRVLKPAISRLASEIDLLAFKSVYKNVYNHVGTPGTAPATALTYLQAGQKLSENACPVDGRNVIIDPRTQAATVNGLTGLFNPSGKIGSQYEKGQMGSGVLGFDFFMSQNVPKHTCGTRVGTILVEGSVSTEGSTTIHVDGLTNATDTFTQGDIFTVSGVYAVNPETKEVSSELQQFVVTALATAASNEVDLTVSPAMYTSASGGLQTVSAFPLDGATVTPVGTASLIYPQNLAFHGDGITFASALCASPTA
jgi:hypothetical protein